jgi:hypothetical protein
MGSKSAIFMSSLMLCLGACGGSGAGQALKIPRGSGGVATQGAVDVEALKTLQRGREVTVDPKNTAKNEASAMMAASAGVDSVHNVAQAAGPKTCKAPGSGGKSKARFLWKSAYLNSMEDLFGEEARKVANGKVSLSSAVGKHFHFESVGSLITDNSVPAMIEAQEAVADWAILESNAQKVFGCPIGTSTLATARVCLDAFLDSMGTRILRRPLTASEKVSFRKFFEQEFNVGPREGFRQVLASLLLHQDFLFVRDFPKMGSPSLANGAALDPYSLASRIAFASTDRAPDSALLDAAASGALGTPEGVREHVMRLLGAPAGKTTIELFYRGWLRYDVAKVGSYSPAFLAGMPVAGIEDQAKSEIEGFLSQLTWVDNAKPSDLLRSTFHPPLGAALARVYGATPEVTGSLDARRAGLLTRMAFLATGADGFSVVRRGLNVLETFACALPADPALSDDVLMAQAQAQAAKLSFRQSIESITNKPACAGCHVMINPLGGAFSNFDALGRVVTVERHFDGGVPTFEVPADAKVSLSLFGPTQFVEGGAQLSDKLASSLMFQQCFPSQIVRFALGREDADDGCLVNPGSDAVASGKSIIDTYVEVLSSRDFATFRND